MKKGMKIVLCVVLALVLAIGIFALVWYKGKNHDNFYAIAQEEFALPGLDNGFTPQGLTHDQTSNNFLVTGYMKDGSASRIYITGENSKYFTLKNVDGSTYVGHAGGIATYVHPENTNIHYGYLVGDKKVYVFNMTAALELENGESTTILAQFDAPNGADFINIQDGQLYLGEFYHETKYPTSAKHHISTASGMNYAVTYVYALSSSDEYYFDIENPKFAISTTEKVQGMCINSDGKVVLSTSWSLSDSNIFVYDKLSNLQTQTFEFKDGHNINMYVLDSTNLLKTFTIPSMSEEVCLADGKVYVIFENACAKYKLVTRHKNTSAYSFEVSKLFEETNDQ